MSRARRSFRDIEQITYSLLGLIPYMLATYIAVQREASLPEIVLAMAAAALISHLLGYAFMHKFGVQLEQVRDETARAATARKKERIEVPKEAPSELVDLVRNFNVTVSELATYDRNYRQVITRMMLYAQDIEDYQRKLTDEALMRQHLSRYLNSGLVEQMMHSDRQTLLQNREAEVSVLFADIRSFTTISERMPPEKVVAMLNEYFEAMTAVVFAYDGVLDKFVGDELMAVFGLTDHDDRGATAAVHAAMAMQETVTMLMAQFRERGLPTFEVGIGINTGEVVVGNVGSKNRMDYTVIGDVVNVAARLEQSAKGSTTVIGERTRELCGPGVRSELQGEIRVRNRERPVRCFKVMAIED